MFSVNGTFYLVEQLCTGGVRAKSLRTGKIKRFTYAAYRAALTKEV